MTVLPFDTLTPDELEQVLAEAVAANDVEVARYLQHRIEERVGIEWRSSPLTMGAHFGKLADLPHTRLLSEKFVDAFEGRSPRQIWSLPPQHGKSFVGSKWGPAWALDQDPTIKLALTSYGDSLARENASAVRDILLEYDTHVRLRKDQRRADRLVTDQGGGIIAVGVGSGLTGFGAHGVIVDDPFKNWQEAHSEARRSLVWHWFQTVVGTRLNNRGDVPGFEIVVMCMTGDTAVLMADGSERPLREVRPGDQVATYEDGRVAASTVRNWANQGSDAIYAIRMKSGVVVRANARHPFLTVEDGEEVWQRTRSLKAGSIILRVTGANGGGLPARLRRAMPTPSARACACPTTTSTAGKLGSEPRLSTRKRAALLVCDTDMASTPASTTASSRSRGAGAPYAGSVRHRETHGRIGTASSVSTTITEPARSADCSATTATSRSDTERLPRSFSSPLITYAIEHDEVLEIVACGIEEVFDLQIDRTENFIANGLVSHNTRWHEDDLAGRLVAADEAGIGEGWEVIRLPALAETDDLLGREPGEALAPTLHSRAELEQVLRTRGSYLFAGLYQQRPAPEEGTDIMRSWWRWFDTPPPAFDDGLTSWDMKLKDNETGDFVVGQAWGRTGADYWCVEQLRGQWNMVQVKTAIILLAVRHPECGRHIVENTGNGPEVMAALREPQPGYVVSEDVRSVLGITAEELPTVTDAFRRGLPGILPENPKGDKRARMRAQTGLIEAGNVHLPSYARWAEGLVNEAATFPNGATDDQVDALSQGLKRLRGGSGSVSRPDTTKVAKPRPSARAGATIARTRSRYG